MMLDHKKFLPINADHFNEIASLQTQLLPYDLFSLLGGTKLINSVYPYLMNSVAASRVVTVNGRVIGSAFLLNKNFIDFRFLSKHSFDLTILTLKHPKICISSALAILRRPHNLPKNELLWVCIHPEYQGQGVGRAMLTDLFKEYFVSNLGPIVVRTLEETPGNIRFYESLGFKVFRQSLGRVWLIHE